MEDIIQIFCGKGRGKTSAALGTAFKCLNGGGVAYVMQFNESEEETGLLKKFEPEFKVFAFDKDNALQYAKKVITTRECDVLILDEILQLLDEGEEGESAIIDLMKLQRNSGIRMIITGEDLTEAIRNEADGITEFVKRK